MDDTKEIVSSRHNMTDGLMKPQRLWWHAQGLHNYKTDGILMVKEEINIAFNSKS